MTTTRNKPTDACPHCGSIDPDRVIDEACSIGGRGHNRVKNEGLNPRVTCEGTFLTEK